MAAGAVSIGFWLAVVLPVFLFEFRSLRKRASEEDATDTSDDEFHPERVGFEVARALILAVLSFATYVLFGVDEVVRSTLVDAGLAGIPLVVGLFLPPVGLVVAGVAFVQRARRSSLFPAATSLSSKTAILVRSLASEIGGLIPVLAAGVLVLAVGQLTNSLLAVSLVTGLLFVAWEALRYQWSTDWGNAVRPATDEERVRLEEMLGFEPSERVFIFEDQASWPGWVSRMSYWPIPGFRRSLIDGAFLEADDWRGEVMAEYIRTERRLGCTRTRLLYRLFRAVVVPTTMVAGAPFVAPMPSYNSLYILVSVGTYLLVGVLGWRSWYAIDREVAARVDLGDLERFHEALVEATGPTDILDELYLLSPSSERRLAALEASARADDESPSATERA